MKFTVVVVPDCDYSCPEFHYVCASSAEEAVESLANAEFAVGVFDGHLDVKWPNDPIVVR